jgi:maltooligosyltrehalose trehalohydrolase
MDSGAHTGEPRVEPRSHYHYRLPFGAEWLADAQPAPQTRFRFWAPSAQGVEVLIESGGTRPVVPMHAEGNGWYTATAPCGAGTRYRYRIDGELDVPDPAARFQPDDVAGPSEVIDPGEYTWQHPQWRGRPWAETVLYELHVGAMGGYRGVASRLQALAELGVTTIELMPLNDFVGQRNWGYDGVLPFAPDSSYGRPEELKALIDAAHGLGLSVMLDVVYNHFGPEGNFLGRYAAPFFREAQTPWGQAIDFDRREVGQFFAENALYWLNEYRFDGLRFDAVHAIGNDRWLKELAAQIRLGVDPGREIHLVLENERNTASLLGGAHFDAQWNDDAHNVLHVLLTGEDEGYYAAYCENATGRLARVLGEGFAYQGDPSPIHEGEPRGEPSGHLPPSAFVAFLQNHDQVGNRAFGERLSMLCDADALRAATALLLLGPQVPLLFMDEEYGSERPFLFFTDYHDALAEAVREGRRGEFAKFSAFADAKRRASIPDPNAIATFEASCALTPAQRDEARSRDWFAFYQSALAVRNRLIAPRLHHARALGAQPIAGSGGASARALIARWQLDDGGTLAIALNLEATPVAFASAPAAAPIFETPSGAHRRLADEGCLPPRSCIAWLAGGA